MSVTGLIAAIIPIIRYQYQSRAKIGLHSLAIINMNAAVEILTKEMSYHLSLLAHVCKKFIFSPPNYFFSYLRI